MATVHVAAIRLMMVFGSIALPTKETALKEHMATRLKKGSATCSSFSDLLPAAKRQRIELYKNIPKIERWLTEGREVVSRLTCQDTQHGDCKV